MVFSSNIFLFLFLPIVLLGYYASPRVLGNAWLLLTSLLFYAWGGQQMTLLLLGIVAINYAFGAWIEKARDRPSGRWVLGASVVANLAPLAYYKYAAFFLSALSPLTSAAGFGPLPQWEMTLPVGISFFIFQAMSYTIDVYRRDTPAARNPIDVALYVAFFPQLIAGPIVRYRDVADQLQSRRETAAQFSEGVERFILGLAKKVLLANTTGAVADQIFNIPGADLNAPVAWLGIVCYTLQIYYDFSGYSDMAIGLGLMFGIRFLENFNYPYVSRSVTEFWRRWHISLSVWFRDYLYIPLGGNRGKPWQTYRNLLIVFLLCGLWHGASWNFVVWGLFHGVFLVAERWGWGQRLARLPGVVAHAYTLLAVMGGWVFFRTYDLAQAGEFFATLAGLGRGDSASHEVGMYVDPAMGVILGLAIVGTTPWLPYVKDRIAAQQASAEGKELAWPSRFALSSTRLTALASLLVGSAILLSAATYNPFIYFRF
ncbi:MAG TPA: MBOAT family protein [Pirellulales bacterium]|jgi:alginate O-acetyltransferase complex protein AlgI|nr:MBOAT family protein [Pirellulales bacterium]